MNPDSATRIQAIEDRAIAGLRALIQSIREAPQVPADRLMQEVEAPFRGAIRKELLAFVALISQEIDATILGTAEASAAVFDQYDGLIPTQEAARIIRVAAAETVAKGRAN